MAEFFITGNENNLIFQSKEVAGTIEERKVLFLIIYSVLHRFQQNFPRNCPTY